MVKTTKCDGEEQTCDGMEITYSWNKWFLIPFVQRANNFSIPQPISFIKIIGGHNLFHSN